MTANGDDAERGRMGVDTPAAESSQGEWIRAAVRQYEEPLMLYAQRIVGDPERARDVVQETFLRLCSQDKAAIETHLAEWLFSVCRNQALDVRRKESRMTPLTEARSHGRKSNDPAPPENIERNESAALIFETLDTLPENQQEVIRLKFQSGLSYKEISQVTKLTVTNVGFLIHTALKTIRARINEEARSQ